MKKLTLLVLSGIFIAQVFSQNSELAVDFSRYGTAITGPGYINRSIANNLIHEIERVNRSRSAEDLTEAILNNVVGTPFMNNTFEKGKIYTADGTTIDGAMMRYNVYNDKMEVEVKDLLYELSQEMVSGVKIGDRTFNSVQFRLAKKEARGYLEMIRDGEWKLYCRHEKKFKEAQPQKAMEDRPSPAEFKDLPGSYLIMRPGDKKALHVKNKKDLLNIFPVHKNEIQSYIKKNKLKHNEEEDLCALLTYYESL